MTAVDFGRYKRIVQYFWDPEPTNFAGSRLPVWCLGREYTLGTTSESWSLAQTPPDEEYGRSVNPPQPVQAATPPESLNSSIESSHSYEEVTAETDGEPASWPAPFLDDLEARMWFTYRSNFPAIAKSADPQALSAMTFSVRLRSQLLDQGGFTSDTGWGCMIRSGQSLLANSILFLRLGRGKIYSQAVKQMKVLTPLRLAPW
jgi:cysteine protease ATG4